MLACPLPFSGNFLRSHPCQPPWPSLRHLRASGNPGVGQLGCDHGCARNYAFDLFQTALEYPGRFQRVWCANHVAQLHDGSSPSNGRPAGTVVRAASQDPSTEGGEMKITGIVALALLLLCTLPPGLAAQESATEKLNHFQDKTRKELLSSGMSALLNAGEYEAFQEIFSVYEKERLPLDERGRKLVQQLIDNRQTMTSEMAYQASLESLDLQQKSLALRQKTMKIIAQKLSGKAAARFGQLEDYLSTAVRWEFLEKMPFLGEKKKN
jgi:hypothetical protein